MTEPETPIGVATVEPARPKPLRRFDLRVGDWGFLLNMNSGKFEIYRAGRPDLAHLIVMWGTKSGEVDVHLTFDHEAAMKSDRPKKWLPLFRFRKVELEAVGIHFNQAAERLLVPQMLAAYHKFRPGWLAHRNYFVRVLPQEPMFAWIKSLAPKERSKYRLRPELLSDLRKYPREIVEEFYDPRILRYLEAERDVMVHAARTHRRELVQGDGIFLRYTLGPDGTFGWWGTKSRDASTVHRDFMSYLFDKLVLLVRPEHTEKWEQLVVGLGLDDFEETRSMAANVRRFLECPTNLVKQPYRSRAT